MTTSNRPTILVDPKLEASTKVSVDNVIRDIEARSKGYRDEYLPLGEIQGLYYPDTNRFGLEVHGKPTNFTDHAYGQLISKVSRFSPREFNKLDPDLKSVVFSRDMINNPQQKTDVLARYNREEVRGLLSNRYFKADIHKILPQVVESFTKVNEEHRLVKYYNDDEYTAMRVVFPNITMGKGDRNIMLGLNFSTSDVGRSKLRYRYMIYKLICTNGLISLYGDLFNLDIIHLGGETRLDAIRNQIAEGLDAKKFLSQGKLFMERYMELQKKKISDEMAKKMAMEAVKRLALGQKATETILNIFNDNHGKSEGTRLDFVDAITQFAHSQGLNVHAQENMEAQALALAA